MYDDDDGCRRRILYKADFVLFWREKKIQNSGNYPFFSFVAVLRLTYKTVIDNECKRVDIAICIRIYCFYSNVYSHTKEEVNLMVMITLKFNFRSQTLLQSFFFLLLLLYRKSKRHRFHKVFFYSSILISMWIGNLNSKICI